MWFIEKSILQCFTCWLFFAWESLISFFFLVLVRVRLLSTKLNIVRSGFSVFLIQFSFFSFSHFLVTHMTCNTESYIWNIVSNCFYRVDSFLSVFFQLRYSSGFIFCLEMENNRIWFVFVKIKGWKIIIKTRLIWSDMRTSQNDQFDSK